MATNATPTSVQTSTLKTFFLGGVIITSPNAPLPQVVDEKAMGQIFSDPPFPRECREVRFSSNAYPWLAFAPKKPQWRGKLFGALACNKHTIEANNWIVRKRHRWCLKDGIYEDWVALEVALGNVAQDLLSFSGVALPLDFAWFPMPSRYNYHHGDHGKEKFIKSILLARDAFLPLMAVCSFAIAMTSDFTSANPPWSRRLTDKGIPPSFIDELKQSQIVDFAPDSRCGVFIRKDWDFQAYVDRFVSANVPIWLVWMTPTTFTHHRMTPYCPSAAQVSEARQNPHQNKLQTPLAAPPVAQTILAKISSPSTVEGNAIVDEQPHPPKAFPPIPPQSRQLAGETFKQFFERQHLQCEERRAAEKPHETARRLNREKAQKAHKMPGKGGPRVFIWEDVDGYLIRTMLERALVEDEGENFTDDQRRFNSIWNEWDLAREFAPDQEAVDSEDDDNYRDYMGISDPNPSDIAPHIRPRGHGS